MNEHIPPTNAKNLDNIQPGYLGMTPPAGQLPLRGERMWVERPEQLLYAVDILSQVRIVAIDAEFAQVRAHSKNDGQTSSQQLALLQLAIEGHCFVVDTLRLPDLSPLAPIIANPDIIVLLHGAGADMRFMAERGLVVAHYYDLEATSRSIFGQQESSLAAMLRRAFHTRLDKSLQRTDWRRRPLPPAMVAYAARDAEMTLALYAWLEQHYAWALKLHESTNEEGTIAPWIEPFLRGTAILSADAAVVDAKAQGLIRDNAQVVSDCRTALLTVTRPMWQSRLLRLIADLSLAQLTSDIGPLLQAPTSDERAASARALGRMGVKEAVPLIEPLLQDPVHDVRKAAQTALRNLSGKENRPQGPAPKIIDGTRSWTIGETSDADDENDWKARLRSLMGE